MASRGEVMYHWRDLCDNGGLLAASEFFDAAKAEADWNEGAKGIFGLGVEVFVVVAVEVDADGCSTAASSGKAVDDSWAIRKDDSQTLEED